MITIIDYNSNWPAEFESIRAFLVQTLRELALSIDHIGSTSIPGLGAKDIIDIQVTVQALTPEIPRRLVAAGFFFRDDVTSDHVPPGEDENPALWVKMLFKEPAGERRANIHVRIAGNPNQRYPLLFRDYLRAHPNSARTIELIKRQLAKYHPEDIDAYYDIKDPVYDLIWNAAQGWAQQTGWKATGAGLAARQARLERLNSTVVRLVETCRSIQNPETIIHGDWSVKDILAHLTFWHASFARNAIALVEGRKASPLTGRYVDLNRRSVEECQNSTVEQIIERLSVAHRTIQHCILSPALQLIPYRKGSRDYTPEEHLEIVNDHICEHLKSIESAVKTMQSAGC